jgi:hypothetical protein
LVSGIRRSVMDRLDEIGLDESEKRSIKSFWQRAVSKCNLALSLNVKAIDGDQILQSNDR